MESIIHEVVPFLEEAGSLMAASSLMNRNIRENDRKILEGLYRTTHTNSTMFEAIKATVLADDISVARKILIEYSGYKALSLDHLFRYIKSKRMCNLLADSYRYVPRKIQYIGEFKELDIGPYIAPDYIKDTIYAWNNIIGSSSLNSNTLSAKDIELLIRTHLIHYIPFVPCSWNSRHEDSLYFNGNREDLLWARKHGLITDKIMLAILEDNVEAFQTYADDFLFNDPVYDDEIMLTIVSSDSIKVYDTIGKIVKASGQDELVKFTDYYAKIHGKILAISDQEGVRYTYIGRNEGLRMSNLDEIISLNGYQFDWFEEDDQFHSLYSVSNLSLSVHQLNDLLVTAVKRGWVEILDKYLVRNNIIPILSRSDWRPYLWNFLKYKDMHPEWFQFLMKPDMKIYPIYQREKMPHSFWSKFIASSIIYNTGISISVRNMKPFLSQEDKDKILSFVKKNKSIHLWEGYRGLLSRV